MTVEIIPLEGQEVEILELSISPKAHVKLRPAPLNTIPTGHDATVRVGETLFEIHDYRKRTGHELGAKVVGDGVTENLGAENTINAINLTIFRYTQS
jgi:hypothetical protein